MALKRTEAQSTSPGFDISLKCFQILKIALESGSKRLCSQALIGFQILMSQRSEYLDESLPKLILEAVSNTVKFDEDMYVSMMKIILTIWNKHTIELSFSVIKNMIDQCLICFIHSKEELSKAAAQATLSHILCGMCQKLGSSPELGLGKLSLKLQNMGANKALLGMQSSIQGQAAMLTSKVAAILNHLSDNVDISRGDAIVSTLEVSLQSLISLIDNFPKFLSKKEEIFSIINKKLLHNVNLFLSDSASNGLLVQPLAVARQESTNLFGLIIRLLYSIVTHVELNEELRLNLLKTVHKLLTCDNRNVVATKLDFVKDLFESTLAFSNTFFVLSTKLKVEEREEAMDEENLLKILEHLKTCALELGSLNDRISVQKCVMMLILMLDKVLMTRMDPNKLTVNGNHCVFHQRVITKESTRMCISQSIRSGEAINLPTFKIFKDEAVSEKWQSDLAEDSESECDVPAFVESRKFS